MAEEVGGGGAEGVLTLSDTDMTNHISIRPPVSSSRYFAIRTCCMAITVPLIFLPGILLNQLTAVCMGALESGPKKWVFKLLSKKFRGGNSVDASQLYDAFCCVEWECTKHFLSGGYYATYQYSS